MCETLPSAGRRPSVPPPPHKRAPCALSKPETPPLRTPPSPPNACGRPPSLSRPNGLARMAAHAHPERRRRIAAGWFAGGGGGGGREAKVSRL
mmetsp:Transcript_11328/g.36126  ORF Transcript_11328/g.36126 Transcript_11328/m.36126 type:complete len:93 (+) Transcript_11328:122-400(+)